MKGLLVKDLKYMMMNKASWLIVLAICGINILTGNKGANTTIMMMMVFIGASMGQSTITYDEFDDGMSYIMTLPGARKNYVKEKYIISLMLMLCGVILNIALSPFIYEGFSECASCLAGIMVVMLIMTAVNLPLVIKFGAEKARIYTMILYMAAIGGGCYIVTKDELLAVVVKFMNTNANNLVVVFGVGIILALVVYVISYMVSNSIMRKKEF